MTAHSKAKILKAYADNTALVIFIRDLNSKWIRTNPKALMDYPDGDFFACLPQHKEACLHWLNGGVVQVKYKGENWKDIFNNESHTWHGVDYFMMRDSVDYRIKPRKEKRWICIKKSNKEVYPYLYDSLDKAKDINIPRWWSYHEVEIEV